MDLIRYKDDLALFGEKNDFLHMYKHVGQSTE